MCNDRSLPCSCVEPLASSHLESSVTGTVDALPSQATKSTTSTNVSPSLTSPPLTEIPNCGAMDSYASAHRRAHSVPQVVGAVNVLPWCTPNSSASTSSGVVENSEPYCQHGVLAVGVTRQPATHIKSCRTGSMDPMPPQPSILSASPSVSISAASSMPTLRMDPGSAVHCDAPATQLHLHPSSHALGSNAIPPLGYSGSKSSPPSAQHLLVEPLAMIDATDYRGCQAQATSPPTAVKALATLCSPPSMREAWIRDPAMNDRALLRQYSHSDTWVTSTVNLLSTNPSASTNVGVVDSHPAPWISETSVNRNTGNAISHFQSPIPIVALVDSRVNSAVTNVSAANRTMSVTTVCPRLTNPLPNSHPESPVAGFTNVMSPHILDLSASANT
ncbi:hypothetical protein JAAARDRAFT_197265 [Jaapia argillacea MUCL 33604]|uniref:Uncharacterized protein n=1 Tax=Jaapia argillacea MUCL 33604 TaxID=933084 RepID=A0A067PQ72_9AGAM|nr:hypothetical protein JAAARDRAFT_197265 [Jaapia argillacea MUCL 33604]